LASPDDHAPSKDLVATVESMASPLMYIGFGSMEMYHCLTVNWKKAITNINAG